MAVLIVAVVALLLFPEKIMELSVLVLFMATAYVAFNYLSSSQGKVELVDVWKEEEKL